MTEDLQLMDLTLERLGYAFRDPGLIRQAVTHKSFANETPAEEGISHNERLEFLGDAVLNLVTSQILMERHPEANEGELSRMRAALVNERSLAKIAQRLDLGEMLRLGKGEERSGGRTKSSLLADLFEAILAAVYLDGGLAEAKRVAESAFAAFLEAPEERYPAFDAKSRLQEVLQSQGRPPPDYQVIGMSGPDHRRHFTVAVFVEGEEIGRGSGSNKKEAEQAAADLVLKGLKSPGATGQDLGD